MVLAHFFLFCNVLCMSWLVDLIWAVLFVLLVLLPSDPGSRALHDGSRQVADVTWPGQLLPSGQT